MPFSQLPEEEKVAIAALCDALLTLCGQGLDAGSKSELAAYLIVKAASTIKQMPVEQREQHLRMRGLMLQRLAKEGVSHADG